MVKWEKIFVELLALNSKDGKIHVYITNKLIVFNLFIVFLSLVITVQHAQITSLEVTIFLRYDN